MASRTDYIVKNAKISVASKVCSLFISFATRTIFVKYLGTFCLGINGLYTEVLQILNFAELGFGAALTFAMYAPVANCDEEKTIQLLDLYRKIYRKIAGIVIALGLAVIPFLQYIVNAPDTLSLFELRLYFVFFLSNSVLSYMNAEKVSYLNALQKNYVATRIEITTNIVTAIVQTIFVLAFRRYVIYLAAQTTILLLSKIYLSVSLRKKYPILRSSLSKKMSLSDQKSILHEVKNLAVHKFSSIAVHATDNIIISAFAESGIILVGLISNYNLVINSVLSFVVIVFGSLTSSFGNLVATSDKENYRRAFLDTNFMNFWIYGFCSIAFFSLLPSFISIWLGSEYLIDSHSFLLIVINCYLQGQTTIYNNARDAAGKFEKDSWIAVLQAITNLVVSLVFVQLYGLVGVYIGTVVSRLLYIVLKPYKTYFFLFGHSVIEYYFKLLSYLLATVFAGTITHMVVNVINGDSIGGFVIKALIVAIIPNVIFLALFSKSQEYGRLLLRLCSIVRRYRK